MSDIKGLTADHELQREFNSFTTKDTKEHKGERELVSFVNLRALCGKHLSSALVTDHAGRLFRDLMSASRRSISFSFSRAAKRSSTDSPANSAWACPTASSRSTLCFMRSKVAAAEPFLERVCASPALRTARERRCCAISMSLLDCASTSFCSSLRSAVFRLSTSVF